MRATAGSATAPAASDKNRLRRSFIAPSPSGRSRLAALRRDAHAVAVPLEDGAELFAAFAEISEGLGLVVNAAKERLVVRVGAHEADIAGFDRAAVVGQLDQHADPIGVCPTVMAGR